MISEFEELLQQLSKAVNTPLHLDEKNGCALLVDEKLKIQIEPDKNNQRVIFSAYIANIPPGRFRENVLIEALKANDLDKEIGSLGYSSYHDILALFYLHFMKELNGEKMADILATFVGRAMEWKNAVESGFPAPPMNEGSAQKPYPIK